MISKINPMISKINPRFIVNMMSIIVVSVAGIATIGSVHAEESSDSEPKLKVLATEGFVRGGLATRASHSDIAMAVSALVPISQKGVADGVASLGADGKVPAEQLPTIPNGSDYLPVAGGTMTGAIAMGSAKITNLGAPTDTTDAATKGYADSLVHFTSSSGNVPSWSALRAQDWAKPHWGDTWEIHNGSNKISGVAACLGNNTDDTTMNQTNIVGGAPTPTSWGKNCFCRVSAVNGIEVLGSWVFTSILSSSVNCNAICATHCSLCVRIGTTYSCTRDALFSAAD